MTKDFQRKGSLKRRLAVIVCLVIVLSGGSSFYFSIRRERGLYNKEKEKQALALSQSVATGIKNSLASSNYEDLALFMERMIIENPDIYRFVVLDDEGKVVFDNDKTVSRKRLRVGKKNYSVLRVRDRQTRQIKYEVRHLIKEGGTILGEIILSYYTATVFEAEREKQIIILGKTISESVKDSVSNFDYYQVGYIVKDTIKGYKDIVYCVVVDLENVPIFHTNTKLERKKLRDKVSLLAGSVDRKRPILVQKVGSDLIDVAVLLESKGKKLGIIRIGYSLRSLNQSIRKSTLQLMLLGIFFLILGMGLSFILAGRISKPVLALATLAEKIGKGILDEKAEAKNEGDEIQFLAHSFNQMIDGLRERDLVKDTFSRYVTKDVAEKVLKEVSKTGHALKGERRKVTVMFSDVRGFTKMAEKLTPEEVVELLNDYFEIMVDVVFKYEGTLDKFMGDCIMTVFGAPFYHGDDEERAIQCAIEMQKKIHEFTDERKRQNKKEIEVGIGVHTGYAVAGNIGSRKRVEYTVIGDTVNTAFRIQGLAQKGEIIISESTYLEVKDRVEAVSLPPVTVKGREEPVAVFKLMSYLEKKERRRYKRIHTNVFIKYKVIGKDKLFSDALANISGGGCLVLARERLYEGNSVALEISFSEEKTLKGIEGKIIECALTDDGFYKVRVEYEDISQDDRDDIVKFVYEEIEKGAQVVE